MNTRLNSRHEQLPYFPCKVTLKASNSEVKHDLQLLSEIQCFQESTRLSPNKPNKPKKQRKPLKSSIEVPGVLGFASFISELDHKELVQVKPTKKAKKSNSLQKFVNWVVEVPRNNLFYSRNQVNFPKAATHIFIASFIRKHQNESTF